MRPASLVLAVVALMASAAAASAQPSPIVIKASTVLDGTGKTLTNVSITIEGSKIVRIEPARPGAFRAPHRSLDGRASAPGFAGAFMIIGGGVNS